MTFFLGGGTRHNDQTFWKMLDAVELSYPSRNEYCISLAIVGYINTPENSFPAEIFNWKFGHPPNFQVSAAQLKLAFVDFSGVSTISGGYAAMFGEMIH